MSYKVVFRDKSSKVISDERGDNLKAALMSAKTTINVDIDGEMYRSTEIMAVKKAYAEDGIPATTRPDRMVSAGKGSKCKGQYSIQLEIMKIAKEVSGREGPDNPDGLRWPKLLQDKNWKTQMRKKLRSQAGVLWCDNIASECACDPDKEGKGMDAVHEIFFGPQGKGATA